ncbi:MAG: KTSC domain-containing protein [Prochloraceae cyanobacterium]|nr:KTSC domain-containing protein [Prochloraceae cyanobacterium]
MENRDGVVYQYEQTVEVRVRESISVVEQEDYSSDSTFSESYESRFASSSEYLQIQLSDGSAEEYGTYAGELTAIASRGEESSTENIYLSDANYDPESECLRMEFDDGTVYEYEEVSPDFWQDFQKRITED